MNCNSKKSNKYLLYHDYNDNKLDRIFRREFKVMKMDTFTANVINIAYAYGGRVQATNGSISAEFEKKEQLVGFLNELEKHEPGYLVEKLYEDSRQVYFSLPKAA
jgi:hypothetical protein